MWPTLQGMVSLKGPLVHSKQTLILHYLHSNAKYSFYLYLFSKNLVLQGLSHLSHFLLFTYDSPILVIPKLWPYLHFSNSYSLGVSLGFCSITFLLTIDLTGAHLLQIWSL